jgi:hypothetical protein
VYIGRSNSGSIATAGGAGNEFRQVGASIMTYNNLANLDAGSRNGISIWLSGTNWTKFKHEVGHLLSYGGGYAPLGIPAIPFDTPNNPQNIFDLRTNASYRHWLNEDCRNCREHPSGTAQFGRYNPTSRAAVLMERVPGVAQPYQRQGLVPATVFGLMLLR